MVSEPIASLILALIAVTTSAWLTGRVRAYALARQLLDVPNVRSSHSTPTPRGGGVAIVVAVLLVLVAGVALKVIDSRLALALGGGGLLVAWVGWWDDHTGLRPQVRAAGHAVAALWALYWLGGYPTLRLGDFVVSLGPAGSLLALIGIVWAVNLFNFMDGIDGIAGVEAVTVGTGGALLLWAAGQSGEPRFRSQSRRRRWAFSSGTGRLPGSSWEMRAADFWDSPSRCSRSGQRMRMGPQ